MRESEAFEEIYEHLLNKSFGFEVNGDETLCRQLKQSLPDIARAIKMRRKDDVRAEDICYRIALEKYGINLAKMISKDERRNCFEAAQIMILYLYIDADNELMVSIDELLSAYPEFNEIPNITPKELESLLRFRNTMHVAQRVIEPKNHKEQLLNLVTRISEGRTKKYITGSGESVETSSRVLIYRREGDVTPVLKKPRQPTKVPEPVSPVSQTVNDAVVVPELSERVPKRKKESIGVEADDVTATEKDKKGRARKTRTKHQYYFGMRPNNQNGEGDEDNANNDTSKDSHVNSSGARPASLPTELASSSTSSSIFSYFVNLLGSPTGQQQQQQQQQQNHNHNQNQLDKSSGSLSSAAVPLSASTSFTSLSDMFLSGTATESVKINANPYTSSDWQDSLSFVQQQSVPTVATVVEDIPVSAVSAVSVSGH